jgi:hypothetical protein
VSPVGADPGVRPARRRSGPKTAEGKRAVSRNAIKHAIFSPHPVVIAGLETIDDWEDFQAHVAESWDPQGEYERQLAYDIAFGLWRLRRCRVHEAAQLTRQVYEAEENLITEANEDDEDEEDASADDDEHGEDAARTNERPAARRSPPVRIDPLQLRAHQLLNVVPQGWSLDRILRYETHVRRALLQTIHELEARQARRLGERPPLARVDFTASPSLRHPTGARSSSAFDQLNHDLDRAQRDLAKRKRARRPLPGPAADDEP